MGRSEERRDDRGYDRNRGPSDRDSGDRYRSERPRDDRSFDRSRDQQPSDRDRDGRASDRFSDRPNERPSHHPNDRDRGGDRGGDRSGDRDRGGDRGRGDDRGGRGFGDRDDRGGDRRDDRSGRGGGHDSGRDSRDRDYGGSRDSYSRDNGGGSSYGSYPPPEPAGPWDPKAEAEKDESWARIYVNNLPKDTTTDELQSIFGGIGVIAKEKQKRGYKDQWPWKIKIYTNDDGTPKGDAVITYEDANAARTAPSFFNGSDIRGNTITVELAGKPEPPAGGWVGGPGGRGGRGGGGRGGGGRFGGGGRGGGDSRYRPY